MEEILTPPQVADLLKIHVKTVYKLAREGALAGSRIGRSWRFDKRHLMEHLSSPEAFMGAKNANPVGTDTALSK